MSKDKTAVRSGRVGAAMMGDHVPRIVRLIKANPGLTATEIYNLRNFSFKRETLNTILVVAKQKNLIRFENQGKINGEARWYVVEEECQTEAMTEEAHLKDTSLKS